MFTSVRLKVVLALTIGFVVIAEAQQQGDPQKSCLTPREAFEVNRAKAPLCKAPDKPAVPSSTTRTSGAVPVPAPSVTAAATISGTSTNTSNSTASSGSTQGRGSRPGPSVTLVSLDYAPLSLKYSIQKRTSTGRDWTAANPDSEFLTGDRIKLIVEANEQAYLYVYAKGASGTNKILFPDAAIDGEQILVPAHRSFEVPSDLGFIFVAPAGQERITVFLSRRPVQDLQELNNSLEKGGPSPLSNKIQLAQNVADGTLNGIRARARDLVLETVNSEVYVANGNGAADALVWADVLLTHR
jgi:hypothetical protein